MFLLGFLRQKDQEVSRKEVELRMAPCCRNTIFFKFPFYQQSYISDIFISLNNQHHKSLEIFLNHIQLSLLEACRINGGRLKTPHPSNPHLLSPGDRHTLKRMDVCTGSPAHLTVITCTCVMLINLDICLLPPPHFTDFLKAR